MIFASVTRMRTLLGIIMQRLWTVTSLISFCALQTVLPDLAIYWTLGKFLKPLATIHLSKSRTVLGNFCEVVKICHISREIIFGQLLYRHLAIFFCSHCLRSMWHLKFCYPKQYLLEVSLVYQCPVSIKPKMMTSFLVVTAVIILNGLIFSDYK